MTATLEATGLTSYYSEMGEQRPVDAQIDAQLSHYGKHYFLKTPLVLKGRGVEHLETLTSDMLVKTPAAQAKVGWHRYKVTIAAFEKICREHRVANEMLLD